MSRKGAPPPDPRDALLGALDSGQTGCLVSRAADASRYRVYVMLGEILAAHGAEDDLVLLDRLEAGAHVGPEQLTALRARVAGGGALVETLFELMPEEALLELLYERFRENLLRYLGGEETESFHAMEAVFTDNIQVGHDSRALVEELVRANARTGTLRVQTEMVLAPGAASPETDRERALLARCGARVRLGDLVETSGFEPGRVFELVQDMLDRGTLLGVVPQPKRKAAAADEAAPAPAPAAPVESPLSADDRPDAPTVEAPARGIFDTGWDDDLAAFQDYDTSRGGGSFLTDRKLLDRVDLDPEPPEAPAPTTETLIEMVEAEGEALKTAVSLNFSGPKLHDEEIQRKLAVTNEVLVTIAQAIEAVEGRGAGQARLQLLVEGTSVPLAPLFKGVELSNEGRLPVAQVVKNLRKRPAGEHRRLLNRGLSDLIERALSAAYESLDEPGLEAMLERIAGYQQRLGV